MHSWLAQLAMQSRHGPVDAAGIVPTSAFPRSGARLEEQAPCVPPATRIALLPHAQAAEHDQGRAMRWKSRTGARLEESQHILALLLRSSCKAGGTFRA